MKQHTQNFWVWSFSRGMGTPAENRRWTLTTSVPLWFREAINYQDGKIASPAAPIIAEANRLTRVEDVPWTFQGFLIVSDRTRLLIDHYCQDNCEFFPVEIRCRGRHTNLKYWAVHIIHTIDCADRSKSYKILGDSTNNDKTLYLRAVVIEEKVPQSVSIFRIANASSGSIVRASFRNVLRRERVTGCTFYEP